MAAEASRGAVEHVEEKGEERATPSPAADPAVPLISGGILAGGGWGNGGSVVRWVYRLSISYLLLSLGLCTRGGGRP